MSGPLDRFARPCECLPHLSVLFIFRFGRVFRVSLLLLCLAAERKDEGFFVKCELVIMRKKKTLEVNELFCLFGVPNREMYEILETFTNLF